MCEGDICKQGRMRLATAPTGLSPRQLLVKSGGGGIVLCFLLELGE